MISNPAHAADILNKIKDINVLVIGDIMLDRFVYGSVDRISPESPVPVLSIKREDMMLGGAGNALANLHSLKAKARILAVVGDDTEGRQVHEIAQKMGFDTAGLIVAEGRPTTVKTRYLAGHQQLLRTDYESISEPSQDIVKTMLEYVQNALDNDLKAVLISDYGKGLLSKDLLQKIIKMARKKNVPVLVDPKGRDYSIYAGASLVTPNKKELSEATNGMRVDSDEDVITAARKLIDQSKIDAVLATRSRDGMTIVHKSKSEPQHFRTADIEVFDVSGAGDTVIATVAAALAAGGTLEDAAALANIAGGIVVAKVGTAPIRADELMDAIQTEAGGKKQASICNWDEAREQVQRWKAKGLKVGFTNGCFDILHYGHVSYLAQTREHCDRLIVGLNKDSSVKILKGPERPVHDEDSRAHVLGALASTDMVVFFGAEKEGDDNTACDLLSAIQPDLYFKGGDYTVDQIPEAPTVMAYGGEVKVMPVYEGHSTTSSIEKMKSEAA